MCRMRACRLVVLYGGFCSPFLLAQLRRNIDLCLSPRASQLITYHIPRIFSALLCQLPAGCEWSAPLAILTLISRLSFGRRRERGGGGERKGNFDKLLRVTHAKVHWKFRFLSVTKGEGEGKKVEKGHVARYGIYERALGLCSISVKRKKLL